MDLQLNEQQVLISETANKYINDNYSFEFRNKLIQNQDSYSKKIWRDFAEMGWLGLPFKEEDGGFSGNAIDIMVLMEAFGKGLVIEPFLSSVLLGGKCLSEFGTSSQKSKYLKPFIDGQLLFSLAFS